MLDLSRVKQAIRNKYAWPGGYPLFLLCEDGGVLSIDAARECWRQIAQAHIQTAKDARWKHANAQWLISAAAVNWEDPDLFCDHSGARIESAYAEPE